MIQFKKNSAAPSMNKVFSDGYMSIFTDRKNRTLYYKIVGYPRFSEIIRGGHDKIYELINGSRNESSIKNLVADLLEAKILLTPDIKWIATVSYPRLHRAGIQNLAILCPQNVHVQMNVEKTLEFMGATDTFDQVKVFDGLDKAMEWFKEL